MINHFQSFLYPGNNLWIDNFYGVFHQPKIISKLLLFCMVDLCEWQRISLLSLTKQRRSKIKTRDDCHMKEAGSLLVTKLGSFCRYRKALYFWSLGISLYLELFCFLSFITIVLRNLCSGTHRRNPKLKSNRSYKYASESDNEGRTNLGAAWGIFEPWKTSV